MGLKGIMTLDNTPQLLLIGIREKLPKKPEKTGK
jgi:hypothetical protein